MVHNIISLLCFGILLVKTQRSCGPGPGFPGSGLGAYYDVEMTIYNGIGDGSDGPFEAPIFQRRALSFAQIQWNCAAAFDSNGQWLTLINGERGTGADNIPNELLTSDNMLLCYAYGMATIIRNNDLDNNYPTSYVGPFNDWGLTDFNTLSDIEANVRTCPSTGGIINRLCLEGVAALYGHCPDVMGVIIANEIIEALKVDGWNSEGNSTPYGECTANCNPFSDPLGIFDDRINNDDIILNGAGQLSGLYGFSEQNPAPYVGLTETDGNGFFVDQIHVVPHIGFNVAPVSISLQDFYDISDKISEANYDYTAEAALVIERLANTAVNDTRKFFIEIFDDKGGLGKLLQFALWGVYNPTYEQNVMFEVGNRVAEYEAVLYSWREKIRYNLIRPTTIIKSGQYTNEFISTWGGPFQGVQSIRFNDIKPFVRVMPHSEYPSGSGCICRMLMDFVDKFVQSEFPSSGLTSLPVVASKIPGIFRPSQEEPGGSHEDLQYTFTDMEDLYFNCKFSRLWGAQHFTASIEASDVLCDRSNNNLYDYLMSLNPNSGFVNEIKSNEYKSNNEAMKHLQKAIPDYIENIKNLNNNHEIATSDTTTANGNNSNAKTYHAYQVLLICIAEAILLVGIIGCIGYAYIKRNKMNKEMSLLDENQQNNIYT